VAENAAAFHSSGVRLTAANHDFGQAIMTSSKEVTFFTDFCINSWSAALIQNRVCPHPGSLDLSEA
jgi:hypothetical protein